jgi:hypothetical protein
LPDMAAAMPHRHPGEVIMETLHVADVLFRRSMAIEWDTADREDRALVIEALERAQRFARAVIETAAYERAVATQERIDHRRADLYAGGCGGCLLS